MKLPRERTKGQVQWMLGMALGVLGICGASCTGPKQYLKGEGSPILSYSKSMCFGPCPAFTLEVESDGTARFNGRAHIEPKGPHTGKWSTADLEALAEIAHSSQLRHKAGTYDNPLIMDLPSTRLTMGPYHVLDRINGPDLSVLYYSLDSLIRVTTWTPEVASSGKERR